LRLQWVVAAMLSMSAGCVTVGQRAPDSISEIGGGEISLVYVQPPRLCSREVQAYSDFAFIRPSQETVVGNTTCDGFDGMGAAEVVWWRQEGSGRWEPSPDIERKLHFKQEFIKGSTAIPKQSSAMEALLAVAKANPGSPIRLTVYSEEKEHKRITELRTKAVRDWLARKGVDPKRVIGVAGSVGTPRAEAEIVVIIKG